MKKSELVPAAEELNEVLGLEPKIDGKKLSLADLKKKVVKASELIESGDTFSENTTAMLKELGVAVVENEDEEEIDLENGEDALESTPKPEEKESKAKAKSIASAKPAAKNTKAKASTKAPAAKTDKPKGQTKSKKEKPAKAKKTKKFSRKDAVVQAIQTLCKDGATLKDIMEKSDELYVQAGGSSNPTATNINSYILYGLVAFGVLTDDNNTYRFKG